MGISENFQKNYANPTIRKTFKDITGLEADKEPAAFIAFLNNISLNSISDSVNVLLSSLQELNQWRFQQKKD